MSATESEEKTFGKYPEGAGVMLAAREGSERYYFRKPTGGIASIPAMDAEQARRILADGVHGFGPEDFEQVAGFDAEPWDYPDPVDSDRNVNEHDLYMLRYSSRRGRRRGHQCNQPRKNPTEHTLDLLMEEWGDTAAIPVHDRDALQQANGIGPYRAGQVVGAAVANRLIERPVRGEYDA